MESVVTNNDVGSSEERTVTVIVQTEPESSGNDHGLPNTMLWSKASILKLIQLHKDHQYLFDDPHYKKKSVWEMIMMNMRKEGYTCTLQQAENKWKSLTKKYRDVVDHNAKRGHISPRKCAFYNELSLVYDYTSQYADQEALASSLAEGSQGRNGKAAISKNERNIHQQIVAAVSQVSQHSNQGLKRSSDETNLISDSTLPHEEARILEGQILKKKKKYNHPPGGNESDVNRILHMLQVMNEDRKKMERLRMEKLEKMHQEKVSLFKDLLTAIKTIKPTSLGGCTCAGSSGSNS